MGHPPNAVSAARLLGNGNVAQAFGGNTFSSLSQLALGPGRINGAISTAVSGPGKNLTTLATQAVGSIQVAAPGTGPQVVGIGEGYTATIIGGATRSLSTVPWVASLGAKVASAFDGKLIYDGATYLISEGICAAE